MADVKIYANYTPNYDHYFFGNKSSFDVVISSHLVNTYTLDNARLINNTLMVVKDNSVTDYADITYVRENRDGFIRYYHVRDVQYMGGGDPEHNYSGGKYIYTLSVDYWATYAFNATYKDFFIQRSNRFCGLDSAKYDNIENAVKYGQVNQNDSKEYNNYTPLKTVSLDDVYIVFAVNIETYKNKSLFNGTITASDVRLYAIRPKDFITLSFPMTLAPIAYIEEAVSALSSIYGISVNSDIYDANVSGLWIVPADFLGYLDNDNDLKPYFQLVNGSHVVYEPNTAGIFQGLKSLHYSYVKTDFSIDNYANKVAFFGTKSAMLELPRTFDTNKKIACSIESIVKKDSIQIIARCGENQLDITDSFSVGLPNTQGELKPEEKIARGVQTVGALAGAATMIAAGNYVAGSLNAITAILPRDKSPNAMYKSNGDGFTTWTKTSAYNSFALIEYPVSVSYYLSAIDDKEIDRVRNYGAIINQYAKSTWGTGNSLITNIITSTAIEANTTANEVYLQATCEVGGVPIEAAMAIKAVLAKGVHLWKT